MSAKKHTDSLPPRTRITLSRPDVSAREAVGIIADHADNRIDPTKAISVTIAGASDINGRLNISVGGWDVRCLTAQPDQYIYARLSANGNLSFTLESMWDVPAPVFALDGDWIDSTLAADILRKEPLPPAMVERYSLFLSLRVVAAVGLFWEVRRIYTEPANNIYLTQSLGIDASNGVVAAETVEMKKAGVLVESRYRDRLNAREWVNKLEH
jgi:hypothetical protein